MNQCEYFDNGWCRCVSDFCETEVYCPQKVEDPITRQIFINLYDRKDCNNETTS